MKRLIVRCLLLFIVWLCPVDVSAQDAPAVSAERRGETVVRRTSLDVIVLADPAGNPITHLPGGWPLNVMEEFNKFLLGEQQNLMPPFIIRNVTATGKVAEQFVEVEAQIEIGTSSYQPVRVPLGFKEGILPSAGQGAGTDQITGTDQTDKVPFRYIGPGSAELTVDPLERQYVAFVLPQKELPQTEPAADSENPEQPEKPDMNQRHTLSLVLWFPLAPHNGTGHRLSLSFPQSLSSQFLLEIPMTHITPSVHRGTLLDAQENATPDNAEPQSTILRIQGLRTDTEIIWEKKRVEVVDDNPVLSVDRANIGVRLDAGTAIYDAVLPVSSETGSFDQLQIRLPEGSVLDREITDRHAVANNYSVGEADTESIVTIQFQQRTAGPVPVQLRTIQQFEGETTGFTRELAGFEVLGAERQTGFVNVSISPAEMRPHWELVRGVHRTEITAPGVSATGTSATSPSTNDTRFEFLSQPFRFRVRVTEPMTRINVEPEYHFHISRGAIVMNARLSYAVSGSKTQTLYLQLSDSQWHCEVTSNFVDVGGVELDDTGLLTIPLNSPRDGRFEINLRASRIMPTDDEQWHRIALPIPQPQYVSWTESASVAIVSDINVEVSPIDESSSAEFDKRMTGLTQQTRRRMLEMQMRVDFTEYQQEPLFYRTEPGHAEFVADVMFRRQQINTTMQTDVRLMDEFNQITQTINYHAAFAPVHRLFFLLPRALEANGNIQVRLGNQTLQLQDTIVSTLENIPDHLVRKMVLLPEPSFQFALTFEYSVSPLVVAAVDDTAPFSLSFLSPVDVPVSGHRIDFFTPPGYRVELQPDSRLHWEPYRDPRRPVARATGTFRLLPQPPHQPSPNRIAVLVSASDKNVSGTTVVERAWLQTWLTGMFRRDLATYTVRSTNDSVMIQLPPNAAGENPVFVWVNSQQVQPNISPTGTLTIPIVPEQHNRPVEISIDYRFPFDISPIEVPIILPSFNASVQYQFWQVILPQSRHVIGYPLGWTLEYDWAWNGLFWWRVPSIRKSDIGFALDMSAAEPTPSEASQYVFSHLQPPSSVTLYIVNRSWIIFGSSSIALLIGLVLIYVPQSRYAGSLFGLGMALVAILLYQPPFVLLMLQAATFGVFLALGAGYVYRIFHRQNQWIPPAFPMMEDVSRHHLTPPSQAVHEVLMDSTSKDVTDTPVVNNGQL